MACCTANVPVAENFKPVYLSKNGEVICDWRVSTLGRQLILLNGNPAIAQVAKLQLELLQKA